MAVENTHLVEFEVNDKVEHPQWGLGVVIQRSGSGEKAKVVVQFYKDEEQKTLMIKYAKLKKVGTASPPPKPIKPIIEDIEEVVPPVGPGAALKEGEEDSDEEEKEE